MTKLTANFCNSVTRPGTYGAGLGGGGLTLLVRQGRKGAIKKFWTQRVRLDGKPINIGLGSYPAVSVKEARAQAWANKAAADKGEDPRRALTRGRAALLVQGSSDAPTFAEAARTVIDLRKPTWRDKRSAGQWQASLDTYCKPILDMPVDQIEAGNVMSCLLPIWTGKNITAKRVKHRINTILDWAIANGHRTGNPVSAVDAALPQVKAQTRHLEALPWHEVKDAVQAMRASDSSPAVKLAFEFAVLTATRSKEALGATWKEIDMDAAIWTIPADRMKAGREHRVPLSKAALAVLNEAAKLPGLYCFPGAKQATLSPNTVGKALHKAGIRAVPHGFRSSFRDWAAESGQQGEAAEAALAHVVKGTEGAYRRTDYLEARRDMMEAWAKVACN